MRAVAFAGLIIITCASPSHSQPIGPSPSTNWWWCDASQAYYPAVRTCATPWRAVDAQGQPVKRSSRPDLAPKWWCDAPPGYYPSVPRCSTPWRAIDAALSGRPSASSIGSCATAVAVASATQPTSYSPAAACGMLDRPRVATVPGAVARRRNAAASTSNNAAASRKGCLIPEIALERRLHSRRTVS